jgi:polyisoprenyl-phosphate glycosyltransferase
MKLAIVLPCYNEEEVLPDTFRKVSERLENLHSTGRVEAYSRAVFVDDGSRDSTWAMISQEAIDNPWVEGIKLSRNTGHQYALLAGLESTSASFDAVISIDADLQDDLGVMDEMVDLYRSGKDIVYGVRKSRKTDTLFKKWTAQGFYKFMAFLGCDIVYNHADYRLTSQRVLWSLSKYQERNLFLRGIFPHMGYSSGVVSYVRTERSAGESKFPFLKMLNFALDGITSFSVRPLRLIMGLGVFAVLIALVFSFWTMFSYMKENVVPGWASTMISIYFLGGVQLLSVGLIGEYISKIYTETKARPRYLVEERTDLKEGSEVEPYMESGSEKTGS